MNGCMHKGVFAHKQNSLAILRSEVEMMGNGGNQHFYERETKCSIIRVSRIIINISIGERQQNIMLIKLCN